MSRFPHISISLLCTALLACAEQGSLRQPVLDPAAFEGEVYPVLLRDCGFPACHGSQDRFFRVFGPGRARLDPETRLGAPVAREEIDAAYERARSMIESAETGAESPLVRKPLAVGQGGASHSGTDSRGRDVYASRDDPGLVAIAQWARGDLDTVADNDGPPDADTGDADALSDAGTDAEAPP